MNNECKVVFLCRDSEKKPCAYHSREIECKFRKTFKTKASCTNKKARIAAMENKIRRLIK